MRCIPLDLAGVAHDLGDQLGQLLDGQLLAGTSVDRLVAGVVVHQEDAQVCKVVHIQELTQRRTIAPAGNAGQILLLGLMETTDERRHHMAVGGMIVVVGAIKIGGHDGDIVSAVLTVQELAVLQAADLSQCMLILNIVIYTAQTIMPPLKV